VRIALDVGQGGGRKVQIRPQGLKRAHTPIGGEAKRSAGTEAPAKVPKNRAAVTSDLVGVRVQPDIAKHIDDWRRLHENLPDRPEAIRRLVELELKAKGEVRNFSAWIAGFAGIAALTCWKPSLGALNPRSQSNFGCSSGISGERSYSA
jgi:hypothetical protein